MIQITDFLTENNVAFRKNVDLKTKTWIKRGGIANLWVQPANMEQFRNTVIWMQRNSILFDVVGSTSNCYFLNEYSPDIVISTLLLKRIHQDNDQIICEPGYRMSKLASFCNTLGIAGYEGFIGLPGTVAGAVVNNAGCYGSLTANCVNSVELIRDGEIITLTNAELQYRHRSSVLKRKEIKGVVTSICFDGSKRESTEYLVRQSEKFNKQRKTYQEHTHPNLGTIFCELDFKKHYLLQPIKSVIFRVYRTVVKNKLSRNFFSTKLFWLFRRGGNFKRYVSKYGVQCFTWQDEFADEAFKEYLRFIESQTNKAVIEIEIKKETT